jgi:hypothetical protein
MILGESITDYQDRLAQEQERANERRRLALLELTATGNAPEQRIRAWEKTHGLSLPKTAGHPVLKSIASATHLTLEQVLAEQRRRVTPLPAVTVA